MDISIYRNIPKVELHQHLDGSLRLQTIIDLAKSQAIELPTENVQQLKNLLVPGKTTLVEYLKAFDITLSVLQTASALTQVAYEVVEDWASDGVIYGEIRFAPELHLKNGLILEEAVQAVLDGLKKGHKDFQVESSLILCAMRHTSHSFQIASLLSSFPGTAFDLAGPEKGYPVSIHSEAFTLAHSQGRYITCHAGEADNCKSIEAAIHLAKAHRIGHGTRLVDDMPLDQSVGILTQEIIKNGIHLEVCLSSNIQTQAAPSMELHPFPLFFQKGLSVSLCTDNPLMSNTTLSQELQLASEYYRLSIKELESLQHMALKASFCSYQNKEKLLNKWPTIRKS